MLRKKETLRAFVEARCPVCGQRVFVGNLENTSCRHFVSVDEEVIYLMIQIGSKK